MERSWKFEGWYVQRNAQRQGPYTTRQLRQLVTAGQVDISECVLQGWRRGDEVVFHATVAKVVLGVREEPLCPV